MKFSTPIGLTAIFACALASCYPVDETPRNKRRRNQERGPQAPQTQALTPEQLAEKARLEQIKKDELARQEEAKKLAEQQATNNLPPPTETKRPPVRKEYVTASKVPGREGYVFSPYNNKPIDVRGIPSGTLVQDPTYAKSEEKFFRVP